MNQNAQLIEDHAFKKLFIEGLGWDNHSSSVSATHELCTLNGELIAQKRGFAVAVFEANRVVLADRQLLRRLHKQLCKSCHENICIYVSDEPKKQVWQWSIRLPEGRKISHREHPFFSNSPPELFLKRINELESKLEEEEDVTITDALNRVRMVLDTSAELDLFARWPSYAKKSDQLAVEMRNGSETAFHEFIEFHQPLARKASKMLVRWFPMEKEDAEQTAMIGLIQAAERFEPERGYQFSTYASYRLRQACQRYGLNWGLPIRIPTHAFWPCYSLRFDYQELIATYGSQEAISRMRAKLDEAGILIEQWRGFMASYQTISLSDITRDEYGEIMNASETQSEPFQRLMRKEKHGIIRDAMEELSSRDAEILRRRYGIECPEQTLEEIGQELGVTRERIRQIQARAEERLQGLLLQFNFFPVESIEPLPSKETAPKTLTSEQTET